MAQISFSLIAMPVLAMVVVTFSAVAQNSPGDPAAKAHSGAGLKNEFKFEVVSIRPVKRGPGVQLNITNPTPNGFTATATLWQLMAFAYGPPAPAWKQKAWSTAWRNGPPIMRNEPSWLEEQAYAVNARVSLADLQAWQNQNANQDLLHSALRAMLKERFRVALHQEPAKQPIFELVVAKKGPRLKPADPNATLPVGVKLESGGVSVGSGARGENWNFYGATMQDLASMLTGIFFDGPVRDRTGLTGRYDFYVPRVETPGEDQGYAYSVDDLGLRLKRGTENRPILVIDHVEKPTPN